MLGRFDGVEPDDAVVAFAVEHGAASFAEDLVGDQTHGFESAGGIERGVGVLAQHGLYLLAKEREVAFVVDHAALHGALFLFERGFEQVGFAAHGGTFQQDDLFAPDLFGDGGQVVGQRFA